MDRRRKWLQLLRVSILFGALVLGVAGCKKPAVNLASLTPADGDSSPLPPLSVTPVTPDNLQVASGSSTAYSVVAAGTGLTFSWKLNGAEDLSQLNFSSDAATFIPLAALTGDNTISIDVQDAEGSTAHVSWTVSVDQLQTSKVTADHLKFTTDYPATYGVSANTTSTSPLSFTWKLDGAFSPSISGTGGTITLNTNVPMVGAHTISVVVTDGEVSDTQSWPLEVNEFSQGCNTLAVGAMCTVAGLVDIGDGENPTTNPEKFHTSPYAITTDDLNNVIWADYNTSFIWYWNRLATDVSRLGQTIPAGRAKIVAGTGGAGTPIGLPGPALNIPMGNPQGVAYEGGRLFVSSAYAHRVLVVDSAGLVTALFDGLTLNHTSSTITSSCQSPNDLAVYGGWLYVACKGTGTTSSRVKRVDLATLLTVEIVAGGTGAYVDGGAATNYLDSPVGLWVDAEGVFVTSTSASAPYIYYVNNSAVSHSYFGGATTTVGNMRRIAGNGLNGNPSGAAAPTSYPTSSAYDIYREANLFWIAHRTSIGVPVLTVANNSGGVATVGSTSISANTAMYVNALTAGFNGYDLSINSSRFQWITNLAKIDTSLWIADFNGNLMRRMDMASYLTRQVLGSRTYRTDTANEDLELRSTEHVLKNPRGLLFDTTTQSLMILDAQHSKIRKLLPNGRMATVAGTGNFGSGFNYNMAPLSAALDFQAGAAIGIAAVSGFGFLTVHPQYQVLNGWNTTATPQTFLGQSVAANRISTLGGVDNTQGTTASSGSIYAMPSFNFPTSVAYKAATGEVFISDSVKHCIKSIDSSGLMSVVAGAFGTVGNAQGNRLTTGRLNTPAAIVVDADGNLFVADNGNSRIVYVNLSASPKLVLGVAVAAGSLQSVLATSLPAGLAIVTGPNVLCVSSNSSASNYVKCYDLATGIQLYMAGLSSTQAGAPSSAAATDGLPADQQNLNVPMGLASDGSNLYIGENGSGLVRKFRLQ